MSSKRLEDLHHEEFVGVVLRHAQASVEMIRLLQQHKKITDRLKAEAARRMAIHDGVPAVVKEKLAAIMEKMQ